jgi:tetratricopeptide (TPR) repeat protein
MVPRGRRAHKHSIFKAILIGCGTFPPGRILLAIIVLHLGVCGESAVIPRIESLIRTREYNHALELTKSALHDTPNDVRLWTLEGIILSMQNENPKALAAFDKALSLSPNYIAALKGKIEVLYQAEDKRAIPVLRHILQLDPRDETAHEMLAVFEARSGNCQPAIDQFLSSTNAIANHPRSLELYGYCLQRTKQAQRAVAVFEQLAALAPEQTYPKYDLAVVLVEAQQNAAAIKALEPLLTPNQSDPEVFSLAAEAYERSVSPATGDCPKSQNPDLLHQLRTSLLRSRIVPGRHRYAHLGVAPDFRRFISICLSRLTLRSAGRLRKSRSRLQDG